MATLLQKFGKYTVTLDNDTGTDPRTECDIEYTTRGGAFYCASLACAMDDGELMNHTTGRIVEIDQATLDDIEKWALENGY